MTEEKEEKIPGFTFTLSEGLEVLAESRERKRRWQERDARVCICGHPVWAHAGTPGKQFCKPARMECPCRMAEPVLEVQDTRLFQYATTGSGVRHALGKGVLASQEKGKEWRWIDGARVCKVCGDETEEVVPSAVTPGVGVVQRPEKMNGLLCPECFGKLGGVLS